MHVWHALRPHAHRLSWTLWGACSAGVQVRAGSVSVTRNRWAAGHERGMRARMYVCTRGPVCVRIEGTDLSMRIGDYVSGGVFDVRVLDGLLCDWATGAYVYRVSPLSLSLSLSHHT